MRELDSRRINGSFCDPLSADPSKRDLDAEAEEALEAARSMPSGNEKTEALKKAGLLRKRQPTLKGFRPLSVEGHRGVSGGPRLPSEH